MNDIQLFNYSGSAVRVVMLGEPPEPWWVAKDVCDILGIANSRDAVSTLDDDERNTVAFSDGNRGNPNMTVISEAGLYSLILRSTKPEAKAFSRWVRHEVLPSINKTGYFDARETLQPIPSGV